jgi:hypothetical protein
VVKHKGGHATWTVGQLVSATRDAGSGSDADVRVEIPRFQRSLVWSLEQRTALIESIHKGYPIGSLLLFKRANPTGKGDLYQIVDGLQRTSTLVEYAKNPLLYAPISVFPDDAATAVASELGKDVSHVRRVIADWMKDTRRLDFTAGFRPDLLVARIRADLEVPTEGADEELVKLAARGLDALRAEVDIHAVTIPVVTYTGDESELPDIFERINQRGTKLNKYEVFAATWLNSETQVGSEEIRLAINEKYDALLTQGFAISGLELDKKIQDFNLFEYLFGLGKMLVRSHPLLFSEPTPPDPTETEPAAFSLSCAVRGQQLSMMKSLPKFMPRAADQVIDPGGMEEAILTAASAVQGWLKPFTGLRLNNQTDAIDLAHGELQIVSMIARAVAGRWDCREGGDWSEFAGWKEDWKKLSVGMPQHYLMDLLEETWRGPIYSTVFSRVWQTEEGKQAEVTGPSVHYAKAIDLATWENALNAWFEKQLGREQRTRSYVRSVDRVFLRFVYTGLVSHLHDHQETFELEHLYPVSRLRELIPNDEPGWPISCVANLALFTKAMNREKLAQTVSEYLAKTEVSEQDREKLDRYMLCGIEDVHIPDGGLDRSAYLDFLGKRWANMKANLYKNLGVDAPKNAQGPPA